MKTENKIGCFWCVVATMDQQDIVQGQVVTEYDGTPVCAYHALLIGRSSEFYHYMKENRLRNPVVDWLTELEKKISIKRQ